MPAVATRTTTSLPRSSGRRAPRRGVVVDLDPVTTYARRVKSGAIPAGKYHHLACVRHLADLEASRGAAYPYRWDRQRTAKFLRFTRLLRHYKGEWSGQRIQLADWQQFALGSVIGWVHKRTGLRRFRNGFWEFPRGQGKSTMMGALLLYLTFFDGEGGADGYTIATKKDQAKIVFNAARQMVLRSPALKKHITVKRYNLHADASESHCEPLGANEDTLDGLRPAVAIADEVHKQATADLIGVVEDGMGTRRQPFMGEITTAGIDDDTTVYGQHYRLSAQVLDRSLDVPQWFAMIASADPGDDPFAEATWRKANPNYGISVKPDHLAKAAAIARANPERLVAFCRNFLGLRLEDREDTYFSRDHWDQCPGLPPDDVLRAARCWVGIDLSSRVDLTAAVLIWALPDGVVGVRPHFWIPEANVAERGSRDRVPYESWVAQGHISVTEGNTVSLPAVRRTIAAWAADWRPVEVAYDPWRAGEMTQAMQDEDGLIMTPVPQQFSKLSEPTKRLQAAILEHRIAHDRHPVLRWMVGNARVRRDDRENVILCKKRSRARIDGLAATVTALARVDMRGSPYDQRDLLVL